MQNLDPISLWDSVLTELQLVLSGANYQTWFKGKTRVLSVKDNVVEIGCSSPYNKTWIEERYLGQLKDIIDRVTERKNALTFSITSEVSQKTPVKVKRVPENTTPLFDEAGSDTLQKALDEAGINPQYSFSNFIVGSSNQLAYAVAQSVADEPSGHYNPLLIYGGVGVGKTHLLQSVGHAFCVRKQAAKVLYISSESFTNDMVDAIQRKQTFAFREKYRNVDLLLVDDVQFIAGRESTQEQFFHTFNELYRRGSQVVLMCDKNPKELFDLQERLRNRFIGGMVAKIEEPDLELREAILLAKSKAAGLSLDFSIIRRLSESIGPSIRELEGALLRVAAVAKLAGKVIDEELVDDVLGKHHKTVVSPEHLLECVADYFSITISQLTGKTRIREAVLPRQIAMYLLRYKLNLSFAKIAKLFGGKDHTTAIYSVNKVETLVEKDVEIHRVLDSVAQKTFGS